MIFLALLISSLAFSFEPSQLTCEAEGKIRFQFAAREVQEASAYCFDASRSTFISKSCLDFKKCAAGQAKVCDVGDWIFQGSVGSPGFKLCQAVKGSPQILEFYDGKKWWSMDRCFFESDQSYIDTGILIENRRNCPKR